MAEPGLVINDGALEAIKWLAAALMLGDHINKYLLGSQMPALYAAGRLAFPLFAFVFAANLARPGVLSRGVYQRTIKRLVLFSMIANVPYIALGSLLFGWYPLNILFSFSAAAIIIQLVERGGARSFAAAPLLFLVGGLLVEYWWAGIAMTLTAWYYVRCHSVFALVAWITATAAVGVLPWLIAHVPMNLNVWSLASFPVIAIALSLRLPRLRWFFYVFYPAHLAVIWLVRIVVQ